MKKKLYIALLFQTLIISAFGITVTTTAPNTGVSKVMTVDNGKVYELNFNTDVLSSSKVEVNIKELGLTIASQQITTNGNNALTFTPTSNAITIEFYRMDMGTASLQFEVDNIQLKEVISSKLTHKVGVKNYELSDHLGNVRTTVSDKKESGLSKVISANDYYPYGMKLRSNSTEGYRYAFNGKEIEDGLGGGGGSTYDYGFRIYNPGLSKFLSVDPLTKSYPRYTPYQFAGLKPIAAIDLDGLEEYIITYETFVNSRGQTKLSKVNYRYLAGCGAEGSTGFFAIDSWYMRYGNCQEISNYFTNRNDKLKPFANPDGNSIDLDTQAAQLADKRRIKKGTKSAGTGWVKVVPSSEILFKSDEGDTKDELENAFNRCSQAVKNDIDDLVGALLADDKSKLYVKGYASQKATDLDGAAAELDVNNNKKLAKDRAEKTRDFLIWYADKYYKKDLDKSKFELDSEVKDRGDEKSNLQHDRKSEIILKN